jgi:hypothetical protein
MFSRRACSIWQIRTSANQPQVTILATCRQWVSASTFVGLFLSGPHGRISHPENPIALVSTDIAWFDGMIEDYCRYGQTTPQLDVYETDNGLLDGEYCPPVIDYVCTYLINYMGRFISR